MTIFRKLWVRLRRRSTDCVEQQTPDRLPEPLEQTALAGLESTLDLWTRWAKRSEPNEVDPQLAAASLRAEKELRRFFGLRALRVVQSRSGESGGGTIVFNADRLFVAYLGRRAAMAVTRKLYSNRP